MDDYKEAVFPAYAGVILSKKTKASEVVSVPRVCGGDPKFFLLFRFFPLVFPAYAGVIL